MHIAVTVQQQSGTCWASPAVPLDALRGVLGDIAVASQKKVPILELGLGITRLRLLEEGRRRVKFVFLVWLGPSSGVITKARSQTHKAAIMADIGQFHLELISENRDELSLDEIWKRLKKHVDF